MKMISIEEETTKNENGKWNIKDGQKVCIIAEYHVEKDVGQKMNFPVK